MATRWKRRNHGSSSASGCPSCRSRSRSGSRSSSASRTSNATAVTSGLTYTILRCAPERYRDAMPTELDRLSAETYVLLTTFRRDGVPVPTAVWVARDGNELLVWTERKAGKVKRVRNNGLVELAPCDVRGRRTRGARATGRARLLDVESERARDAIADKYGFLGRTALFFSRLRGGRKRTLGLAIAVDERADCA